MATGTATARYAPLCGDDSRQVTGVPVDDLQAALSPNDQQRALLDELGNASVKAAQTLKAACPNDLSMTPLGRFDAMQVRLEAMNDAVATMRAPLEAFYNSLTDEQKARFNSLGAENGDKGQAAARACGGSGVTDWPAAQIERSVHPTPAQLGQLDTLKNAATQAQSTLKASCPTDMPATPPARLAAMAARVSAMLDAVKTVRAPLAEFYNSLSDEQKAQFNAIGKTRTRQG